jgi:plasmid stabilization system protein ParE
MKPISWSPLALKDLENVLDYLDEHWPAEVRERFLSELTNNIFHIQNSLSLFPVIEKKRGVRKCVVTKHNSLYFRLAVNEIQILRLYDSRQDPDKLQF